MDDLTPLLDKVEDIRIAIARLEERLVSISSKHTTHEARITDLELWRARVVGMAFGVGTASSVVTSLVLWSLARAFGVSP
jgi:hypothetical protein